MLAGACTSSPEESEVRKIYFMPAWAKQQNLVSKDNIRDSLWKRRSEDGAVVQTDFVCVNKHTLSGRQEKKSEE